MSDLLFPQASEKLKRWSFSGDFGRHFVAAYNLQMWCFGCDIRRIEGNLLIEYGYERHRAPTGSYGSSHYVLPLGADTHLHLLGFGLILHVADTGIVLKRHDKLPRLVTHWNVIPQLFEPHQLPTATIPHSIEDITTATHLLTLLTNELSKYEKFVSSSVDSHYAQKRRRTAPRAIRQSHRAELSAVWSGLSRQASAALA
jgi:hypothetical protein